MNDVVRLLNDNQGALQFIGVLIALIGIIYGYKKINNFTIKQVRKNKYINSSHYEAVRGITIDNRSSMTSPPRPKLGFTIENPQASDEPIILENPERGLKNNRLYLCVHNYVEDSYAEGIKVKVKWPPKGFSTIGLYDRTGNHNEKWESAGGEKIYDHGETVSGGEKLIVGDMIVTRFDGDEGELEYTVYAKNASSIHDKAVITKQSDRNYVGL